MSILGMNDVKENMINSTKLVGLVKAKKAGTLVPEFIYLSEDEYNYFIKYGKVREESIRKIEQFVCGIGLKYESPMFSMRCETKANKNIPRTPPSLLNLGLISRLYQVGEELDDLNNIHVQEMKGYWDRAQRYLDDINDIPRFQSCIEEITWWLVNIYKKIHPDTTHYVILMRMVNGCLTEFSGAGICCDLPDDCEEEKKDFQGIFIPYTQGIPLVRGCWGEGEENISELKIQNPSSYDEIKRYYELLKKEYGEHPYFEYTIEGSRVYILQYEQKSRYVVAGK